MDSLALLATTHAQLLRAIAAATGTHYEGLGKASRCKQLQLNTKQRRHLLHPEVAFNWSRHITAVKCESLVADITSTLKASQTIIHSPDDGNTLVGSPDFHGISDSDANGKDEGQTIAGGVKHVLPPRAVSIESDKTLFGVLDRPAELMGAAFQGVGTFSQGASSESMPVVFEFPPHSARPEGARIVRYVPPKVTVSKVIKKPNVLKRKCIPAVPESSKETYEAKHVTSTPPVQVLAHMPPTKKDEYIPPPDRRPAHANGLENQKKASNVLPDPGLVKASGKEILRATQEKLRALQQEMKSS